MLWESTLHFIKKFELINNNHSESESKHHVCFDWPSAKVLLPCVMGQSRSSTLVLAYLMIHENLTLADAIRAVSAGRNISPNAGFLEQLRALDRELHARRARS